MKNFEEQLAQMSKPEITKLKHEDMLSAAIVNAKHKSVLSWWWLSLPIYIIAALIMKKIFVPHTTLIANINEVTSKDKYFSLLLFLVLPIVFIALNFFSLKKLYFLSGKPHTIKFLKNMWFNALMILLSLIVLIIYLF